jgi:hypothetical protein
MYSLDAHRVVHSTLDKAFLELDMMMRQGNISASFNNSDRAGALSGFAKEIGDAITDYQVNLSQTSSLVYPNLIATDGLATRYL